MHLIFSHFVTFEWLKCSSRIGEWLGVKRFEPKKFFRSNGALNSYRHSRQNGKSLSLFEQCGLIYVTSIVEQRALLVKLMTLLGGNVNETRHDHSLSNFSSPRSHSVEIGLRLLLDSRRRVSQSSFIRRFMNDGSSVSCSSPLFLSSLPPSFDIDSVFRFDQSRTMSRNRQIPDREHRVTRSPNVIIVSHLSSLIVRLLFYCISMVPFWII